MESELVSGFMTEHAASIFVFFFLAEYGSIILMCILISIVLIGGYEILNIIYLIHNIIYNIIYIILNLDIINFNTKNIMEYINIPYTYNIYILTILYNMSMGIKTCLFIFTFIWVRASYPRIRFDQLMSFCWTISLPIIIVLVILLPCLMYNENIYPFTLNLL